MSLDHSVRAAVRASVFAPFEELLATLALKSFRIDPYRVADRDLKPGASRFCAAIDAPADFEWPYFDGKPLTCIAQINIEELPADARRTLPDSGWLAFFFDLNAMPNGLRPMHKAAGRVVHFTSASPQDLKRRSAGLFNGNGQHVPPHPLFRGEQLSSCALTFTPTWDLPHRIDSGLQSLALNAGDRGDRYEDLCAAISGAREPYHHLLGHAQPLLYAMPTICQLVSHGVDCGADSPVSRGAIERVGDATEWQLLLQLDTDLERPGWSFGGGRLYYWIRRSDLAARRFENAWVIFQALE